MLKHCFLFLIALSCLCCDKDANELPKISPPTPTILTAYQNSEAILQILLTNKSDEWRKQTQVEIKNLTGAAIKGLAFHIEGCKTAESGSYNCENVYSYQMKAGEEIASEGSKTVTTIDDFFYGKDFKNNLYVTRLSPVADDSGLPAGYYRNIDVDYATVDTSVFYYGNGRCFITVDNDVVLRYNLYRRGNAGVEMKDIVGKISRDTVVNARLDQRKASDTFDFLTGKIKELEILLNPDDDTSVKSIKVTLN
ncbi:hypothetical protein [Dyadobacter fermentans]|uniref:Uncharacterized protein n=1 Tax=Dyadobacter fermentans (strain ATCC 700827 / DSM 18053 / CIP 107007 / KCTC 52180 / NS114) TaxID=471854 RepID=C6VT93_DYAFD|nr:hypothetical protein [Dyadobacter fermentans]ACT96457.1 hypothetical protein Dfer_5263 [Dyadobacter fermentans DSM 18053]